MPNLTLRALLIGAVATAAATACSSSSGQAIASKLPINFDADVSLQNIPSENGIAPRVGFFSASDGLKLRYAEFDPHGLAVV